MIDLHTHTTASDGSLAPPELVERAHRLGIRTLSVTDHDTVAGIPAAAAEAAARGMEFLPGIEITAVHEQRDVHMLAYFLDPAPVGLAAFLDLQRLDRSRRAREMAARLAALGAPIDLEGLIAGAEAGGRAVARPSVARALLDAGHVTSLQQAFDRWLADGRPAYVPRTGSSPVDVVRLVKRSGGVAGLAHPGLLRRDDLIPALVEAGLGAIEVYHSDHDAGAQSRYLRLAGQHGLAVSGGSDFHGDDHPRARCFGRVGLPRERFAPLFQRVRAAHAAVRKQSMQSEVLQ
ncbi:MAG: PHP domain-containing protein [Acidobacteria bacterium]|nr:PHP domain-containing protein [Acidobacteriota bacterium]